MFVNVNEWSFGCVFCGKDEYADLTCMHNTGQNKTKNKTKQKNLT